MNTKLDRSIICLNQNRLYQQEKGSLATRRLGEFSAKSRAISPDFQTDHAKPWRHNNFVGSFPIFYTYKSPKLDKFGENWQNWAIKQVRQDMEILKFQFEISVSG